MVSTRARTERNGFGVKFLGVWGVGTGNYILGSSIVSFLKTTF